MLVISRHRDEVIRIGEDIVISVIDIRGDKVRIGIEAPREISVHRGEVYESLKRNNEPLNVVGHDAPEHKGTTAAINAARKAQAGPAENC